VSKCIKVSRGVFVCLRVTVQQYCIIQVLAIEFVLLAIDFVLLANEFLALAFELIAKVTNSIAKTCKVRDSKISPFCDINTVGSFGYRHSLAQNCLQINHTLPS